MAWSEGPQWGLRLLPRRKRRALQAADASTHRSERSSEAVRGGERERADAAKGSYESFEELLPHCRRTGGERGRRYAEILSSRDPRAATRFADDLGVALTLVELLRDLPEHAQRGDVYIPAQELVRYHLHDDGALDAQGLLALAMQGRTAEPAVLDGFDGGDVGQLYALMRFQALRARDWLHRGAPLVLLLDRRGATYVTAAIGSARRLLRNIEQHPDLALRTRVSLSRRERAWVLTKALLRPYRVSEQHPAERLL
jgi:phytoene synthase